MVRSTVIGELDMHAAVWERYAIEFNRGHPSRDSLWVFDDNFIA